MFKLSQTLFGAAKSIKFASNVKPMAFIVNRTFHHSSPTLGIEEFFDAINTKDQIVVTGRSWTAADLRRKVKTLFIYYVFSCEQIISSFTYLTELQRLARVVVGFIQGKKPASDRKRACAKGRTPL